MSASSDAHAVARFGPEATSAGAARRFVSDTLASWGCAGLEDVATLLVSELVGNVILHAGTEIDVEVRRSSGVLRVAVRDRSPVLPARKHYSRTSTTGRGLGLVEDLARRWGVEPTTDGKAVWFELEESTTAGTIGDAAELRLEDWDDVEDWGEEPLGSSRPEAASPCGGLAMAGGEMSARR